MKDVKEGDRKKFSSVTKFIVGFHAKMEHVKEKHVF